MIGKNDAQYAYDIVERICTEVGPGLPGSSQEHARAHILQKELESNLGAGRVTTENFTMAPIALLGWLPAGAVLILFSALLNISIGRIGAVSPWISSGLSLAFSVITVLTAVLQFIFYHEFAEPFFEKKESVNVIGTLRKPDTGDVKRLLILAGHHDSAPEMTWLRFLGYGYYFAVPTLFIGFITMLVYSIIQFTGLIAANARIVQTGTLGYIPLIYPVIPSIIFAVFFNRGTKGGGNVPGAADNLSASALVVSLCRFLLQNPSYVPDHTEIRFISFGSEEAGLRGSRRYVERHLDELKRLDARLLNLETITHPEISILTSDVNGTVKNSPEMVRIVAAAADRAGVPYKIKPFPFGGGGTDAGSFSKAGLKATTLLPFKVPQQMVAFYHQKWDAPDVLTLEPLLNVLKLAFEWVRSGGE
ncbi:MAG: M28 family peptidase [Deltaproteobacteria bacterium]|nr:M28 family peptidase [Deltaproteobacteria bacterium]